MSSFTKAAKISDIPPDTMKQVRVAGKIICLANVNGEMFAIGDTCSHHQCSLSTGYLDATTVICPCHGANFDVTTGKNLTLPAPSPVPSYKVKVEGDEIFIEV